MKRQTLHDSCQAQSMDLFPRPLGFPMNIHKHVHSLLFSLVLVILFALSGQAWAIDVYLDNVKLDMAAKPFISDGRVMLPLRSVAEGLGAEVVWAGERNGFQGSITMTRGSDTVVIFTNSYGGLINGFGFFMDVTPSMNSGSVYVPVRFIAEAFNCGVSFDSASQTVNISASAISRANMSGSDTGFYITIGGHSYSIDDKGKLRYLRSEDGLRGIGSSGDLFTLISGKGLSQLYSGMSFSYEAGRGNPTLRLDEHYLNPDLVDEVYFLQPDAAKKVLDLLEFSHLVDAHVFQMAIKSSDRVFSLKDFGPKDNEIALPDASLRRVQLPIGTATTGQSSEWYLIINGESRQPLTPAERNPRKQYEYNEAALIRLFRVFDLYDDIAGVLESPFENFNSFGISADYHYMKGSTANDSGEYMEFITDSTTHHYFVLSDGNQVIGVASSSIDKIGDKWYITRSGWDNKSQESSFRLLAQLTVEDEAVKARELLETNLWSSPNVLAVFNYNSNHTHAYADFGIPAHLYELLYINEDLLTYLDLDSPRIVEP